MSIDKASLFANWWRILAPNAPQPIPEYHFAKPRKFRADFCWPDKLVMVEVDGGQWCARGGRHNTDKDREKMNIAASLGYRVFRFSPDMLTKDPKTCIEIVKEATE